ncbi:MAG: PIN domain-containing protein [Methanocellales archaeon]|nr:PIN domain-containing protein [Methanocellales archaeon]
MKVILDSNALMIPGQFGVDVFAELERLGYDQFLIPRPVIKELETLQAHAKGKDKIAASVALLLMSRCKIIESRKEADDAIIQMAKDMNVAVLTNDAVLRKQLKENGITTIYLRQKKRLSVG